MKVEAVSEVARSVRDSLGPLHLGDAFDASMVREGVDSVVPRVRLVLDCKANVVYIPLLLRETRVSLQAFVRQHSFDVVVIICVQFVVLVFS